MSVIFISHKLQEVTSLSDRVGILRHGKVVFTGPTSAQSPAKLAALMTGHEVVLPKNECREEGGREMLAIQGLKVRSDRGFLAVDGIDLSIRSGEILGLAGVSGNGQKELADALAGLRPAEEGGILLDGRRISNESPRFIIGQGFGYIPEDRNHEGIVPSFSIKENLILKDFASPDFSSGPFLSLEKAERNAQALRERYDIRSPSVKTQAGSLSGGNIQKVILARELARKPKVLVAVYPTRGLDMGAEEFIHTRLLELKDEGAAILLISEELEELMNLSDRIAVIFKGRIIDTVRGCDATLKGLGLLMAGLKDGAEGGEG